MDSSVAVRVLDEAISSLTPNQPISAINAVMVSSGPATHYEIHGRLRPSTHYCADGPWKSCSPIIVVMASRSHAFHIRCLNEFYCDPDIMVNAARIGRRSSIMKIMGGLGLPPTIVVMAPRGHTHPLLW